MKSFCFTVDDNIRFLKDLSEKKHSSIFEHSYLATYKRLHEEFGLKVQLNLFYRLGDFSLSSMSDAYYSEWEKNSDWLKLSFHSDFENVRPYENSVYDEVYRDCKRVNDEIIRFASPRALAQTTTIHYCLTTKEGLTALSDNNIKGLLGLFGNEGTPIISYSMDEKSAARARRGEIVESGGISFASIDIVLNLFTQEEILRQLKDMQDRDSVRVMIHEQYFYPDYRSYQPEFEEKLRATFASLKEQGRQSSFFEELM